VNGLPLLDEGSYVAVTPGELRLDGVVIEWHTEDESVEPIETLTVQLRRKRELWQTFHPQRMGDFHGRVLLAVQPDMPAWVVKRVVASCALAGFPKIDFLAVQLPL
jgi:hypothetical protein